MDKAIEFAESIRTNHIMNLRKELEDINKNIQACEVDMTDTEKINAILQMGVGRTNLGNNEESKIISKALEKQIPKKWEYEQSDETDIYICPICKERFFLEWGTPKDNEYNYCPCCGQTLKWE